MWGTRRDGAFWLPPLALGVLIWGIYATVNTEERYVTIAYPTSQRRDAHPSQQAGWGPRDVGHPAGVALRSAVEQVREVPVNEFDQHGSDDQSADQPGVLLEPGAV